MLTRLEVRVFLTAFSIMTMIGFAVSCGDAPEYDTIDCEDSPPASPSPTGSPAIAHDDVESGSDVHVSPCNATPLTRATRTEEQEH